MEVRFSKELALDQMYLAEIELVTVFWVLVVLAPEVLGCDAEMAVAFDAEAGEEGDAPLLGGFGESVGAREVGGEDGHIGRLCE